MTDKSAETYSTRMRRKLLGGGNGQNDLKVLVGEDVYLLVPPKVKQRQTIIDSAVNIEFDEKGKPGKVTSDQGEMQVQALIACCRDPETRMPVFTMADHDALLDGELTPLFDLLSVAALKLVKPDLEDAKKNSAPTPTASSSSDSPPSSEKPSESSSPG